MKYTVGYLGNNEFIEEELSKYYNPGEEDMVRYINLFDIEEHNIEATAFNGLVFDTTMHDDVKQNTIISNIITSNPNIDIMPIISHKNTEKEFDELAELEEEVKLINETYGESTIPYLVDSKREATLFMNTIFSTLSSKTIRNMEKIKEYKLNSQKNMLNALKKVVVTLEIKDPYTKDHSRRVANYAKQVAIKLGLSEEDINEIEAAGWLHDIGKLAINDNVLLKPGKLDDKEFFHMRSHAELGYILLDNLFEAGEFKNIKKYAKHHHERYDGRGYPNKIAGEDIPLGARILCLADSFDAMTTQRSYNRPRKLEDAILDLKTNAGSQFDPKVVDVFIELLRQEPEMLKETLGITVDEDGYIKVEHGPEIDKEKLKNKNDISKDLQDDMLK